MAEIVCVFGNLRGNREWTDADRKFSDQMGTYWVNFAATGDPQLRATGWAIVGRTKHALNAVISIVRIFWRTIGRITRDLYGSANT